MNDGDDDAVDNVAIEAVYSFSTATYAHTLVQA